MKDFFSTHNYEYSSYDGTVTDVDGNKMRFAADFVDEMNMLIQEIRRLKKENVELKDEIEFNNSKLRDFC